MERLLDFSLHELGSRAARMRPLTGRQFTLLADGSLMGKHSEPQREQDEE